MCLTEGRRGTTIDLHVELVAATILQISSDKQASQRYRDQTQHNSRQ